MRTFSRLFYTIAAVLMCSFASKAIAKQNPSPIKSQNFSLWSEYKRNHFEGLTQAQKTEKLQKIFRNKLEFVQKHGIRRLIVKILSPVEFAFFHPDSFSVEQEDNFYFWACQLANHVQIEALFDCNEFQLESETIFDRLASGYGRIRDYFATPEKPFGAFQNIIEKMEWVAYTNEAYEAHKRNKALISGVTLDPRGIGHSEAYFQNIVNAFDQFRYQTDDNSFIPDWMPENSFRSIKMAMLLPLDMKDFALANASNFPVYAEMRNRATQDLGINLPKDYPTQYPAWRSPGINGPLLDTIYLVLGDERLSSSVYQNYSILAKPDQKAADATIQDLCSMLQKVFHGSPFVKGPGYISNQPGSDIVKGSYTFFHTGSTNGEGQFAKEDRIEIRPPYVEQPILRVITSTPHSNRDMVISSPFSTTRAFENIEYWHCPIPCNWARPEISNQLRSRLYFVVNTEYGTERDKFLGNWHFENFLLLIKHFSQRSLFSDLNGQLVLPYNNLVLYDFSTIPNGKPFPEVNWNLGNQNY